jgi:hypothetical protein
MAPPVSSSDGRAASSLFHSSGVVFISAPSFLTVEGAILSCGEMGEVVEEREEVARKVGRIEESRERVRCINSL